MKIEKSIRISAVALAAALAASYAGAVEIDTGNPDLAVTWGNTFKYNAGWRVNERDPVIAARNISDEGTYSFDRGDMVANKFDLLSELDVNYKNDMGFRVSAALWKDFAFHDDVRKNPAQPLTSYAFNGNRFTDTAKRFQDQGGEFLDAYVFKNFKIGGMSGDIKIGRQGVLWGEALILSSFSVSDNQSPVDGIKLFTTPGVDAKELMMPIGQVSATLQVTPTVSLAAQYYYEHRYSRAPAGGTYLGSTDIILDGPTNYPSPFGNLRNLGITKPDQSGDFGLAARWSPDWMEGGTLGAYYRNYTEKSGVVRLNPGAATYEFYFPEDQKLFGLSMSKSIGGVSVGAELTRRTNTLLNTGGTVNSYAAPRGSVWTGLVNALALFGPNDIWSSASLLGEFGFAKLSEVTANPASVTLCSVTGRSVNSGCSSDFNSQFAIRFTPQWTAVAPGWDATLNLGLTYGLKGNSPLYLPDHGHESAGSYSIGTTWIYNTKHEFTLAYIDYLATHKGFTGVSQNFNGSQRQDRGWLSFTYKTAL